MKKMAKKTRQKKKPSNDNLLQTDLNNFVQIYKKASKSLQEFEEIPAKSKPLQGYGPSKVVCGTKSENLKPKVLKRKQLNLKTPKINKSVTDLVYSTEGNSEKFSTKNENFKPQALQGEDSEGSDDPDKTILADFSDFVDQLFEENSSKDLQVESQTNSNLKEETLEPRVLQHKDLKEQKDSEGTVLKDLTRFVDQPKEISPKDLHVVCASQRDSNCTLPLKEIALTRSQKLSAKKEKLKPRVLQRAISLSDVGLNRCEEVVIEDNVTSNMEECPEVITKRQLEDGEVSPPKKNISAVSNPEKDELYSCKDLFDNSTFDSAPPLQLEDCGLDEEMKIPLKLNFSTLLDKEVTWNDLANFYYILRFIFEHPNFESVFYQEEKVILYDFLLLPETYQFVCMKLFVRLPKWYNMDKFLKEIKVEISQEEMFKMTELLCEKKFIETDYLQENPIDLLDFLNLEEVRDIHKHFKLKIKKKVKPEMIKSIVTYCNNQMTLSSEKTSSCILKERIAEKMCRCFKLNLEFHHILYRLHLIYSFTNLSINRPRDLYNFMFRINSGEIVLPSYTIDFSVAFKSKEEFKRYSLAREFYDEFAIAQEQKNDEVLEKITMTVFRNFEETLHGKVDGTEINSYMKRFTAGNVYAKILSKACVYFAKSYEFITPILEVLISQVVYERSYRLNWMNQLALISEKYLQDTEKAAQILVEALCSPLSSTQEIQEICKRATRLIKRKTNTPSPETVELLKVLLEDFKDTTDNIPVTEIYRKSLQKGEPGKKTKFEDSGELISVEQLACNYYTENGSYVGVHCEGSLMINLYFLLFWDIIYKYHAGSFISEIQYIPLDFYSKEFYLKRKHSIDLRLDNIETGWSNIELELALFTTYQKEKDKYPLVEHNIKKFSSRDDMLLIEILRCIDRRILRNILYKLIIDFKYFSSGMPDLFLWSQRERKCKFVEVKGGNDKLSLKQTQWLKYLIEIGADAEVCHVNT